VKTLYPVFVYHLAIRGEGINSLSEGQAVIVDIVDLSLVDDAA
jgi:cold shock CspA family protein